MISYKYSSVGGYSCAVIAAVGFILNTTTFIVLGSQKKLRQQPTTVIILVITMFDIFYTAVILPFHAINMLDCWSVFLINLVLTGSFSFRYCSSTNILCKMFAYSLYMTMGCVLFLQGVLAISRWAAVCKQYWFSVRKSMCASVMGCLVPAFLMFLPALEVWGDLGFDEGTGDNEISKLIYL